MNQSYPKTDLIKYLFENFPNDKFYAKVYWKRYCIAWNEI